MPTRHRSSLLGVLTALLVAGSPLLVAQAPAAQPAASQTLPAPVKVTSVEGITEYRLANGLRVLLFPDASKPSITVNITYNVGSRHENYGETGMAHLLEHLVFKGTPNHPDIPKELTAHGARPNGSTSFDRTNYFETFQADEKGENLKWALELEADRMVNSHIAQKDLWDKEAQKGEMTVVRNEMESGENDPFRILMQRVMATAFEWHNYGKDTIGARADVENVNIGRLKDFYHKYYQPDNATLLVAGKIDEARTLALVNETFGRSEERRVGKECRRLCRSRWSPYH
jgi:zinc protease